MAQTISSQPQSFLSLLPPAVNLETVNRNCLPIATAVWPERCNNGCRSALYGVAAVVARVQLLRLEQQRERGAAGHRAPHIHVRRRQVVEHARRLVGVRRAHRHVQHAPCEATGS